LRVRMIREFNLVLLSKWCWRLKIENRSLWYRTLVARYREIGWCIADGGKSSSVWWNNLNNIMSGAVVGVGHWFDDNVRCEVGDGSQTLFWWVP
jgi:hypothetical protein